MLPQIQELIDAGIVYPDVSLNKDAYQALPAIGESSNDVGRVIGADSRVLVPSPSHYPYWPIVRLILYFTNAHGTRYYGRATGFLIRQDMVATAGHCIYDTTHNVLVDDIVAITEPASTANNFAACTGYRSTYYPTPTSLNDWTLFKINKNLGAQVGILPVLDIEDATTPSMIMANAEIPGYPSIAQGLSTSLMWTAAGVINGYTAADKTFNYTISTSPGDSGAPVLTQLQGNWYVIGIHISGDAVSNHARAIDHAIFNEILVY